MGDDESVDIWCRCHGGPPLVEFIPLFAAWQCAACKRAVPSSHG